MSFRMQLSTIPQGRGSFEPLSFSAGDRQGSGAAGAFNPVLAATVGEELEYGHLFSYLFRRFGYPNQQWDTPDELARYLLTTPHPDLFLSVGPRVDGRTDRSFAFLGPSAVVGAAQAYVQRTPGWRPNERALALADWDDADPLKPYAVAAQRALENLMQAVRLGDQAIDVFGSRPVTSGVLVQAASAGHPFGAMINANAGLFAELQSLVVALGQGNARRGLKSAVALLRREALR